MTVLRSLRRAAKWLLRLRPATVHAGPGSGLKIDMRRASGAFDLGTNEMPVQDWLASQVKPGMTFYDVGANIGFFALLGARLVGESGKVVAFEPVRENAEAIRRNADLNGFDHVVVVEVALSSRTGEAELVLAAHPGGAALRESAMPPDATTTTTVPTATLDSLVQRSDFPPPDIVKIDVEGAELAVLDGMSRVALEHRPRVVCEVDGETSAEVESRLARVDAMLKGWGYATAKLPDSYAGKGWTVAHIVAWPA